mmetsp:Transcript_45067/g.86720  ORF Transcript_45067/g.86720 Transcript_45067/m.86720 type:complete len:235 (+) Transcript_45067:69-773(+)
MKGGIMGGHFSRCPCLLGATNAASAILNQCRRDSVRKNKVDDGISNLAVPTLDSHATPLHAEELTRRILGPNPALDGNSVSLRAALAGWYLFVLRMPSGMEDFCERVEVVCLGLMLMGAEQRCSFETRVCLHDPHTGAVEPDAQIFNCPKMSGTWRIRAGVEGSDADIFCRLEAEPGELSSLPGPTFRTIPMPTLRGCLWSPGQQPPRQELEEHWSRWGVASLGPDVGISNIHF